MFSLVQDRESKCNPLSRREAAFYFQRFLRGVAFLHQRGIAHLDLSLENSLHAPRPSAAGNPLPALAEAPGLVLCDLGQAVQLGEGREMLGPNFRRGREAYMSPEMWEGGVCNGLESDMFSCGVVLFILLTGVPPFHRASMKDPSFRFISRGRVGLEALLKGWGLYSRVSHSALDLLARLLCPARTRLSVFQALQHPYFVEHGLGPAGSPRGLATSHETLVPHAVASMSTPGLSCGSAHALEESHGHGSMLSGSAAVAVHS
jgi:serine/threonine protein kinase